MVKRYKKFLLLSLLILCVPSFSRLFNNVDYWLADIFSHFPVQYALLALIIFSICLWKHFMTLAALAGLLFLFNISAIVDFGGAIHAAEHAGIPFKIYSANLHIDNDDLSQLNKEVKKIDPDILLLLEVTPVHFKQLQSLIQTYPHHTEKRSFGGPEIGFVFLSKFPILNNHVTKLSNRCNFFLEAMIEVNQKPVVFYGVHAQRPDTRNYIERKNQFRWLSRRINEQSLPAIVAGDFNTTPYSPILRELVKITGLKDSREGFGWQPSWPTYFPPLWIPIDHVLVTPDIQVRKRTTGSYIGSDHYPVITELSLG
jgi:endonuclease/exonuclease/phosphatase (EEP) superfamily protein YafD